MAKYVTCTICKIKFNRESEEYIQVSERRYAHKECFEHKQMETAKEQENLLKLHTYIKTLFGFEEIPQKILRQISSYVKEYEYSYSGILQSLLYFYEIKKNDLSKANGGIGIVPYIYDEARRYFFDEWQRRQKNAGVKIDTYLPQEEKVTISSPQRKPIKRNQFSFLD